MSTFLLDTHALLWAAHDTSKLPSRVRAALEDSASEVWVSAVSAMEIATKHRRGQLTFGTSLAVDFARLTSSFGFEQLPVTAEHAQLAGSYGAAHRDPWDRLLAAQAQLERMRLISCDRAMTSFNANTFW